MTQTVNINKSQNESYSIIQALSLRNLWEMPTNWKRWRVWHVLWQWLFSLMACLMILFPRCSLNQSQEYWRCLLTFRGPLTIDKTRGRLKGKKKTLHLQIHCSHSKACEWVYKRACECMLCSLSTAKDLLHGPFFRPFFSLILIKLHRGLRQIAWGQKLTLPWHCTGLLTRVVINPCIQLLLITWRQENGLFNQRYGGETENLTCHSAACLFLSSGQATLKHTQSLFVARYNKHFVHQGRFFLKYRPTTNFHSPPYVVLTLPEQVAPPLVCSLNMAPSSLWPAGNIDLPLQERSASGPSDIHKVLWFHSGSFRMFLHRRRLNFFPGRQTVKQLVTVATWVSMLTPSFSLPTHRQPACIFTRKWLFTLLLMSR